MYIYDFKNFKLETVQNIHEFELEQNKDSFDDWDTAFINAVNKRFTNLNHEIILPLSPNDSGSIACAMDLLKLNMIAILLTRKC